MTNLDKIDFSIKLPESGNVPILSVAEKILEAVFGPLLRYHKRANAVNDKIVNDIYKKKLADSGHDVIPKLDNIKTFEELSYYSDLHQRADNLKQNIIKTIDIFEQDISKIDSIKSNGQQEDLNIDWFMRWRLIAESTSDEDMQNMWARILAEEIITPGSVSLRTLDVLKNVTSREAKLFVQVSQFILNDILVCSNHRLPPNCTFDDIIDLIDAGLLTSQEIIRHKGINDSSGFRRFEGAGYWLYIQCQRRASPVAGMALSRVGKEILKISDRPNAGRAEITKICDIIRSASAKDEVKSMKAVMPGCPYAASEESILYRYPYISSRRK